MVGLMSEAYAGNGPAGAGADGAAAADGPATTCGAGVASGVAACATGAGASYAGVLTGTLLMPDVGVVGGACGSGG